MKLSPVCAQMLLQAEAKALATFSVESGTHVVPVSTIKFDGDEIILVNYFFGQTLKNLLENKEVALAFWSGLEGYQIKADAYYETEGERFESVVAWIKEILPERIVKGVVVLKPKTITDVSADAARAGKVV
jgi:predicted pyridoxine 5'-phosphate oxidase superfamily flavin-nucleotide-binding protein